MAELKFTILGSGSSGGVPRLGGNWGACDPTNPKNRRLRCSLLVERTTPAGTTRVLIDTSPDLREQMLAVGVGTLDGVIYTHSHADHTHGIDDLRMIVMNMRHRLNVWADAPTRDALVSAFGYTFVQPDGSPYPTILKMNAINGDVAVSGPGGDVVLSPFQVDHGAVMALGFRIGPLAYLPDVKNMTPAAWAAVTGIECWVLDALRRDPHPTHVHLDHALDWIAQAAPGLAVLTNMHIDLDYATVEAETPANVTPAYDGMTLIFED